LPAASTADRATQYVPLWTPVSVAELTFPTVQLPYPLLPQGKVAVGHPVDGRGWYTMM
jgi:hypothetical protein